MKHLMHPLAAIWRSTLFMWASPHWLQPHILAHTHTQTCSFFIFSLKAPTEHLLSACKWGQVDMRRAGVFSSLFYPCTFSHLHSFRQSKFWPLANFRLKRHRENLCLYTIHIVYRLFSGKSRLFWITALWSKNVPNWHKVLPIIIYLLNKPSSILNQNIISIRILLDIQFGVS